MFASGSFFVYVITGDSSSLPQISFWVLGPSGDGWMFRSNGDVKLITFVSFQEFMWKQTLCFETTRQTLNPFEIFFFLISFIQTLNGIWSLNANSYGKQNFDIFPVVAGKGRFTLELAEYLNHGFGSGGRINLIGRK